MRGRGPLIAAALLFGAYALACAAAFVAIPASALTSRQLSEFTVTDDMMATKQTAGSDWQHAVQIVANLRAQPPTAPLVVLLGGSSARECTVSDSDWEAQIGQLGGPQVDAYNLGSRNRTYAQDLDFVKLLPANQPTIVYLGINLSRFCNPPSSPTITLPSPLIPPPPYNQHIYSITKRIQLKSTKRFYVKYWLKRRLPQFNSNFAYNMGVIKHIIQACQASGLHPVLVDLPRDLPIIGHSFDVPVGAYHLACKKLAAKYKIPWLSFVSACKFVNGDFFDIFHTVEPGRVKFQYLLSQRTVALLNAYGMTPSPSPSPSPSPPSPSPSASPPSPSVSPNPSVSP